MMRGFRLLLLTRSLQWQLRTPKAQPRKMIAPENGVVWLESWFELEQTPVISLFSSGSSWPARAGKAPWAGEAVGSAGHGGACHCHVTVPAPSNASITKPWAGEREQPPVSCCQSWPGAAPREEGAPCIAEHIVAVKTTPHKRTFSPATKYHFSRHKIARAAEEAVSHLCSCAQQELPSASQPPLSVTAAQSCARIALLRPLDILVV